MAVGEAGVIRSATGEVVARIMVEVDDNVVTTWDGSPEPAFGPGHEFDLDPRAQIGVFRTAPGVYGPPPDTRSEAEQIRDAIVLIDALVQERIVTAGFVYNGLRFSSSKEAQLSWAALNNTAGAGRYPEPLNIYVNNQDDTDGMTFDTAQQIRDAYDAGVLQGAAYKQVGARAKKQARELGAAALPAVIQGVRDALAVDALDLIGSGN